MSHITTAPVFARPSPAAFCSTRTIPPDLRIPAPPFARWIPPRREPAWREAMRWSLIALTASFAAGEAALALMG